MKRGNFLYILVPAIIVIAVFAGFVAFMEYRKNRENDDEIDFFDQSEVNLVIGSELIKLRNPPIVKDNEIALPIGAVRAYFDPYIFWDSENKRVTITTADKVIRMNTDRLTTFANDREVTLNFPAFEENGAVYIPLKFLKDVYMIDISYIEESNAVVIDRKNTVVQVADVIAEGAALRSGRSVRDPIVKRLEITARDGARGGAYEYPDDVGAEVAGSSSGVASVDDTAPAGGAAAVSDESAESVNAASDAASNAASATAPAFATATATAIDAAELFVFEHYDGWYKARAKDGTVGYIEKKYVSVRMYVDTVALLDNDTEVWKPDRGKINMTWDLLATSAPDISEIQDMPGLDVISPTWFELADKDGVVTSIASTEYIEWAHNRGYKVWALFRNNFNDIGMTSAFMNNSLSREEAIRSILIYAAILKIDGINLDFENMYLRDREAYTQFVREFAPMIREQGLTFSVCVNIPDGSNNWSKCFDSPAIADASDYIAVTTYDQTGASSSTPGSVAQYNWVETNVKKMVERDGVPPEKLILGIPFYTRLWEVESGSAANPKVLKTRAIHMDTAINMVTENSAEIIWDKPSAQFYSEFTMDGGSYRMWLDEMNSINYKTSLVHKYDLAGVSSWARAFAHPDVWDVIRRNLKVVETYRQWAEANDGRDPEFMFYN